MKINRNSSGTPVQFITTKSKMGAGQIGGMATLLDLDFENAAGFIGTQAKPVDAQYLVYYMSHSMLFCVGALLEAHVVLTPASCVFGEVYKFEIYGASHMILQEEGSVRIASDFCIHKGYNNTLDGSESQRCFEHNIALIVLDSQFPLNHELKHTNRIRYGWPEDEISKYVTSRGLFCTYYGWGSRRNGFLVPLLLRLQKVEVFLLQKEKCDGMCLANEKSFLCLEHPQCVTDEQGSLCPDDLGTVLDCFGFARGLMVSRIIDRPCGAGFLDILHYLKFITCGIDDAREIMESVPMDAVYPELKPITPPVLNETTPIDAL